MNIHTFLSVLLSLFLVLGAGCSSSPQASAPGAAPAAVKYVKTEAFLLVGNPADPDRRTQAEMAAQFDLGFLWWNTFEVSGDQVTAQAGFTTRKSQVLHQEDIDLPSGPGVIRKLDLEVSDVPGIPGSPGALTQEIPIGGIKSPEGLLMSARMEFLQALGRPSGWIRLVKIARKGDSLVLTWDVRY